MWTFKNLFALCLFLFGTTFLWMTAAFAGKTPPRLGQRGGDRDHAVARCP
jgi:hypothetical protein